MCLISWGKRQKGTHINFFSGFFFGGGGVRNGAPNGPFSATKSFVYCFFPARHRRPWPEPLFLMGLSLLEDRVSTSLSLWCQGQEIYPSFRALVEDTPSWEDPLMAGGAIRVGLELTEVCAAMFLRDGQSTVGAPKWTKMDLYRPKWTKMDFFGPFWSREC